MSKNATNASRDLLPIETSALTWEPSDPAGCVYKVANTVMCEARKSIDWYLEKKSTQRRLSRTFRIGMILLGMVAALVPILGEVFKSDGNAPIWLSPGWASVALVLAATLLALDRFYGCSSSWMRFMSTELQIREALHAFSLTWQIQRAEWADSKPSEKQVREGLESCRAFLAQLDALLRAELDAWVEEFRTSLKDIDQMARGEAMRVAFGSAAINVEVKNGDACDDGWTLRVDNGTARVYHGKTATVSSLLPGYHKVQIAGRIAGREVVAERSINVAAGTTPDLPLTLA